MTPARQPTRARETERQLTHEERFALLISVIGANPVSPERDPRIEEGVPMSAGHTAGVPRLGRTGPCWPRHPPMLPRRLVSAHTGASQAIP